MYKALINLYDNLFLYFFGLRKRQLFTLFYYSLPILTKNKGWIFVKEDTSSPSASLPLDILLALAHAAGGVAHRFVVVAAGSVAITRLATPVAEVVEVGVTPVTLLAGHTGLTLAPTLAVALQEP